MNSSTPALLGHAACVLLAIGAAGLLRALAQSPDVRTRMLVYHDAFATDLKFLQRRLPARTCIAAQVAVVCSFVVLSVCMGSLAALALVVVTVVAPRAWLGHERARRVAQLEGQLGGWLTTLANALKANPSLGDAIESTVPLVPCPMSAELDLVVKERRLGTPLDRALSAMATRAGSRVIHSAVVTLRIARQTGGDLGHTLESSAASLRELARVEGVVRSKTAEGRAQSLMIGALPAPLFFMLELIEPGYLAPLFASLRGSAVLGAAGVLWAIAIIWSRRIVAVDV